MRLMKWLSVGALLMQSTLADTTLYDDGAWRVVGADDPVTNAVLITVLVGGEPVGEFSELKVFRSFSGGLPQVVSLKGSGALRATPPLAGDFGGTFYLTQVWDCFDRPTPELAFVQLDIQPNKNNRRYLKMRGQLTNGDSLQAGNLRLRFEVTDDANVQANFRYSLFATADICVDPWRRQLKEGFRLARIRSNFLSSSVHENDGARAIGVVGEVCDCCDCRKITGSICAPFVNGTGYVFSPPVEMGDRVLTAFHSHPGPANTPALRITVKKPKLKRLWSQGFLTATDDATTQNVELWVHWGGAEDNYRAGQKLGSFDYTLSARIPESFRCDFISP
jgi:hypothetical protein